MKAIALVLTFAALATTAAAQEKPAKPTPSQEIAKIVAVEEQERDLAKAETLYREALAGKELSAEARALATQRLGGLLYRLGRREEAVKLINDATPKGAVVTLDDVTAGLVQGGQDAEREKALREKARELVRQVLEQKDPFTGNGSQTLAGIANGQLAEQLMWLGEAAVPEVAGALTAQLPLTETFPARLQAIAGLAGFLWLIGGDAAATHLRNLARDGKPKFRAELYRYAQFRDPRMVSLAIQLMRDEADEELVEQLLWIGNNLWWRVDVDAVVDLLVQKGPRVRRSILRLLCRDAVKVRPEALAKVHVVVQQALQSSDPELGRAAQEFLMSQNSQASARGVELLLDEMPKMRIPNYQVSMTAPPAEWLRGTGDDRRLDPAVAAMLWPRLLQCARALGRDDPQVGSTRGNWLLGYMFSCARELDARIVPDVLTLVKVMPFRPGFNVFDLLRDKITVANAAQVFAAYGQLPDANSRSALLAALERVPELPTELYEPLMQAAAAWEGEQPGKQTAVFVQLLASTGHPDAATRVLEWWRANRGANDSCVSMLVRLGRRTQAEPVRAAMREIAADKNTRERSRLLLALLSMHDGPALDLVVAAGSLSRERHPYAKAEQHPSSPGVTPLEYLLDKNPDPPHGFSEDDGVSVLQKMFAGKVSLGDWSPRRFTPGAMSDRLLGELARLYLAQSPQPGIDSGEADVWLGAVLQRVRSEGGRQGALRDWIAQRLEQGPPRVRGLVLGQLEPDEVKAEQARIVAFVDGEDEGVADRAVFKLEDAGIGIAAANLAKNRHPRVRQSVIDAVSQRKLPGQEALVLSMLRDPNFQVRIDAATCLGALVSKEAVPGLIELLRDSDDQVRKAAADSLTRIRFYHEQQAHWDRVTKGMDASPASAAEKLLLQAKPGAPKAQRLLAITSLGTLGVPEALPFLIDWTQDADADVAKAAKDAITQIHLNPRK